MSLTAEVVERRRGARPGSAFAAGKRRVAAPFLAVPVLLYTALFVGPTLYSLYASFTDWDGINTPKANGVHNYVLLLHDPTFHQAFTNTVLIAVVVGIALFALSFVFLLVLREMWAKKFIRGVIFLPHIISSVVLAIFWGVMLRYNGLANNLAGMLGHAPVEWLGPHTSFRWIMVAVVWINAGYYVTILMAGVDRIPPYFYEDAELAGANAVQRFFHVTLPLSWDVVGVAAVLWTISSVKLFEFVYAFGGTQGQMPPIYEWTSAAFVYGETVGGTAPLYEFGYACASAVVTLAFVIALVAILRRAMRREKIEF